MNDTLDQKDIEQDQAVFREPRIRKLVKITLFVDNTGPHDSFIRNISTFGIRATSPVKLQRGQSIAVTKEGYGKVRGTVRWVTDKEFGLQFDQPIDIDQFNFGSENRKGHFLSKKDNGHVWIGFDRAVSTKRPGFNRK
ncbi:MAG: PilZ domain-containing protein [Parasphingorhabdus sp.]|uniref:PilZ domain-containing protein n=1 Tax=Parasphingorhabdus sp. TaxID=2709688 RepID=UPI0030035D40